MKTFVDPEENAYPAGTLRESRRRFKAKCPDGVIRSGICSIPDTSFSIPARLKARGKTVAGFISLDNDVILFTPDAKSKNRLCVMGEPFHVIPDDAEKRIPYGKIVSSMGPALKTPAGPPGTTGYVVIAHENGSYHAFRTEKEGNRTVWHLIDVQSTLEAAQRSI